MIIWADMLVLVVFAAITLVAGNFRQRLLSILINLGFYSVAGYQWSNGDAIGPQISMLASGLACTLLLASHARSFWPLNPGAFNTVCWLTRPPA